MSLQGHLFCISNKLVSTIVVSICSLTLWLAITILLDPPNPQWKYLGFYAGVLLFLHTSPFILQTIVDTETGLQ